MAVASNQPYTIFKQNGSSRYYVRFSIRGQGQQRIALGTEDPVEAESLAQSIYFENTALAKAGLSVTRKKFADIAEEFAQSIEVAAERGEKEPYHARQYPPIIRKYFVGFFGQYQLTAIKPEDIQRYWEWRKEYWITGEGSKFPYIRYQRVINGRTTNIKRPVKEGRPSPSTLNKEAILLRQLFEFGQRRGYTLDVPMIELPKSKKREVRRTPDFTLKEFLHLVAVSEQRVKAYEFNSNYKPGKRHKAPDEIGRNQRIYFDRLKLHNFCMIAAFSGLRTTELFNLSWGHVGYRPIELDDGKTFDAIILQVRGKGKEREMAAQPETLTFFNSQRMIFQLQAEREPRDGDPVFFNHHGDRIRRIGKGLCELLKAADLRESADGRLRDSRSFRHFYITQQLREGVGHHILGRNTGTSIKMLDEVYSHVQPTDQIKQLIPDWLKRRPLRSPINTSGK